MKLLYYIIKYAYGEIKGVNKQNERLPYTEKMIDYINTPGTKEKTQYKYAREEFEADCKLVIVNLLSNKNEMVKSKYEKYKLKYLNLINRHV